MLEADEFRDDKFGSPSYIVIDKHDWKITPTKFIPTLKIGYQIKAVETLVFLTWFKKANQIFVDKMKDIFKLFETLKLNQLVEN